MAMHASNASKSIRRGVTLLEVIVCIAVLAMLFAILLPAFMASRAAADAVGCRARMNQVGRAVHNFEERHRRFPDANGLLDWQFELLPELDRSDLFRQLQGHAEESTVLFAICPATSVPILQCPSDSKFASAKCAVNFLRNGGATFYAYEEDDSHGFNRPRLSSRDVTDGLSMTAYVSERSNELFATNSDRRAFWTTPVLYVLPLELDLFANLCEAMPNGAAVGPDNHQTHTFFEGSIRYDHIARPNHATCKNAGANFFYAAFTANSLHAGGVNVLMADGAVRFVNDHVTRPVWRAMGTRNGRETFTLP